ncbi:MAG: sugar ABC transporter ATP-binding protein [Ilumatobacteraceae bacterium]|nr:sugar ABC transporter ATP-binding protein [Ilumatobacteraceae bacterium]
MAVDPIWTGSHPIDISSLHVQMIASTPTLNVRSISKTYPGQVALNEAHLQIFPGEIHALIGQNGSGKSTLIKLIAGYIKADHGAEVEFSNERVDLWRLSPHLRTQIRIVHQDLGLVPTLSAIENLGLGRGYETGFGGRIKWRAEARRCQELLLRFGLAPDVRSPLAALTSGERAAVAIVRALQDWNFDKPGLLILDEPTAALNRGEVDALFSEVRRVASLGVGVIFVSHMLEEVLDLADKVTVLRDGNVVASGENVKSLSVSDLVHLMVGKDLSLERNRKETEHGRAVLEAENLFGITLRGVSFKAHAGEIVGVAGLIGSGREEVANCLFGVTPRFMGKVLVNKKKVFAHPHQSIKARMALVPADRKRIGLILEERLEDHIPLPRLSTLRKGITLDHKRLKLDVTKWINDMNIEPPILRRKMSKFSGGNQQKAVLARWLRTDPQVLILDEPTQGVDIGSKSALYERVESFAQAGGTVVVASSDTDELIRLCDRVLIMRGGTVACELFGKEITASRIVTETLGATSNRVGARVTPRKVSIEIIREAQPQPAWGNS